MLMDELGLPSAPAETAEIARLQNDLLAAQSRIEDLTGHITSLQTLNTDYENAISHTLDKMRPFAHSHGQALLVQKAHYLNLLEQDVILVLHLSSRVLKLENRGRSF